MIFNKSECILFIKLSYFLFSCGSQLLKSRVNAVLELMRHISLLDLVKVKNFRIPELRLSFEDSELSFPLLLHSGVCLWCSMWRWLPLKQIPWSSGFFRFYITWRWWSNFGSEQFENLFRVHFFFEKTIIRLHRRQLCFPPELKAAQFLSQKNRESFRTTNKHFMNYL